MSTATAFVRTCSAERLRLRTVRSTWWSVAAATVVMVGLGLVAGADAASDAVPPQGEPAWRVATIAAMPAQFALLALALVAVTADYATSGIVPTLQWTPRRGVLLAARGLTAVLAATLVGALLALACGTAAHAMAPDVLTLPWDAGLDAVGTVAFVVAAGSAVAVGLGLLLRGTAGGLVSVFLLMLVLPLLLPQLGYAWTSGLAEVLPGSAAAFLLLGEVDGMTTSSSVVVLLCWTGGALLLGGLRLVRDDADR